MKRIFVCSPFAAPAPTLLRENVLLAESICRQIALAGDAPFAPHLLLPRFLRDDQPDERDLGIRCGLAWLPVCDELWVYGAESHGMRREIHDAQQMGIPVRRPA
ncbi:MAG: hypothetical protein K8T90_12145 [Planctomycetes bacterium]|nr:hypothetical protein [Planctomycetota bacterium]